MRRMVMKIPTLQKATALLDEAGKENPGTWTEHSKYVATAAKIVAEHADLNPDDAYILGLLHDIGRRAGQGQMRHVIDGYTYLEGMGHSDAARICLTHSFSDKNMHAVYGKWDCTNQELKFIKYFLQDTEYNDYDRLIQLCDSLAVPSGFCLIEKKMIASALKYGTNNLSVEKWKSIFTLKGYFENRTNCSIYTLLPGIVANTFETAMARD